MQKQDIETRKEMLLRFQRVVGAMTQEQVDACAWMMGGFAVGWTPGTLRESYQPFIDGCTED